MTYGGMGVIPVRSRKAAESAEEKKNRASVAPQPAAGLRVRMFTAFYVEYDGAAVTMPRGGSTKIVQLFAMLLLAGEKGVPKRELISNIYGQAQDAGADLNQYVNNLIYRLKKWLASCGMTQASVTLENGICCFRADFPIEVDVLEFQRRAGAALEAERPDRDRLLAEAVGWYSGEFLPEFCTELWVIQKNHELEQLFVRICERLGQDYREDGNLYQAREIYHRAAVQFPFDSWQLLEIDCLIALKDYDGAYAVYQDTERLYDEELGIAPDEKFGERLAEIEKQSMRPVRRLSDILKPLREKEKTGAYYCYYSDFLHFCQVLARIAERSGQSLFLLLCTWRQATGGVKRSRCPAL